MKFLLLIAHGSRNEAANEEVRELAERIDRLQTSHFEAVVPAFLEFAEPAIGKGIDLCAQQGAKEITVMPYFLALGKHVGEDIPGELARASARYPEITINLSRHFGAADTIAENLLQWSKSRIG